MADVLDISHHHSHESVQPLSHWMGHYSCPGWLICCHILILRHTHKDEREGLSGQEERVKETVFFLSKFRKGGVTTPHFYNFELAQPNEGCFIRSNLFEVYKRGISSKNGSLTTIVYSLLLCLTLEAFSVYFCAGITG